MGQDFLRADAFMMPPFLIVWCVAAELAGRGSDRLSDRFAKAVLSSLAAGQQATAR